jgi:hypothetical protein
MFLSGTAYKAAEAKCWTPPNWEKVWAMICKYGPAASSNEMGALKADFTAWKDAETLVPAT